jgi:hypothetical protein
MSVDRRDFMRTMGAAGAGLLASRLVTPARGEAAAIDPTKVSANLRAGGGTVGGIGYVQITGFAKTAGDTYPDVKINVVPGGWIGNIPRTNKGELDLASTTRIMTKLAVAKQGAFTESYSNVRSIMNVQDQYQFIAVVRKDAPVSTVADIVKNKAPLRLTTLARGNATEWIWRTAFEEMGGGWEQLTQWGGKMSHVTWPDGVNLIKDGHADGILAVVTGKIGWLVELTTARDMKFLTWDQDLLDHLTKKYGFVQATLPAGEFRGQAEPVKAPSDGGVFIVRADLAKDVVYASLRAVAEHADKFKTFHPALAGFKPADMAKDLGGFPLHQGAELLYKEKGYLT